MKLSKPFCFSTIRRRRASKDCDRILFMQLCHNLLGCGVVIILGGVKDITLNMSIFVIEMKNDCYSENLQNCTVDVCPKITVLYSVRDHP